MYRKERGLIDAFLAGKMSRRSLIKRFAALGVSAGTAGTLLNMFRNQSHGCRLRLDETQGHRRQAAA